MTVSTQNILVGVTGGIAAYKSAELVRRLRDAGASVRVVMTRGAQSFITPLTLQAVSGEPVHLSLLDESAEAAMGHIELARWADKVIVAPATAHALARLANGMADDLLSTLCLATNAPIYVAPAMNQQMWQAPAVQANVAVLISRGVSVLGPADGSQACGDVGPGRMLEPLDIAGRVLAPNADAAAASDHDSLHGEHVLISAGPTREAIDPVRYISNHSSGKMGFAVAAAAKARGATVTLVAGPTNLDTPAGVDRIDVVSAREMHAAIIEAAPRASIFVSAAAVADYAPASEADRKLKKNDAHMTIELVRTPDILAAVAGLTQNRPFTVGFAAETHDLRTNARGKLERKNLDMIAANEVGEGKGFNTDSNALTVYWSDGELGIPMADKRDVADALWDVIAKRLTVSRQT
jgi:phosphopantothenoylcysteine decarboxylase/phosphopantothenate--cysteine ligase